MKRWKSQVRPAVCLFIVLAFLLPAYRGFSGFRFVTLALNETEGGSQLNFTDALVVVLPLLLVPATAAMLLLRSLQRVKLKRFYTALPLLFLLFFTGILFWGERNNPLVHSLLDLPRQMQIGYYLAYLACLALPFTRNPKRRRRRRSQQSPALPELAV